MRRWNEKLNSRQTIANEREAITNRCNSSSRFLWYSSDMLQVCRYSMELWWTISHNTSANVTAKTIGIVRNSDIRRYAIILISEANKCKFFTFFFMFCVRIENAATSKQIKGEMYYARQRYLFLFRCEISSHAWICRHWILTFLFLSTVVNCH